MALTSAVFQFPVGSHQRLLKMATDSALLGTQHDGLDWGNFPAAYGHQVQGIYLNIKLPYTSETGDRVLANDPSSSARLTHRQRLSGNSGFKTLGLVAQKTLG